MPVILIHKGDSAYLPATIFQLRYSNPLTPIYLIGDRDNAHYSSWVNHHHIDDFFHNARAFEQIYEHFSTNGRAFELFCLQRWFVLRDFMQATSLVQCLYIDSDVLFYSDINDVQGQLLNFAMTVTGISAHTNFINDSSVLSHFCDFIWYAYENERENQVLATRYEDFLKMHPAGGISDMTFFTEYRKLYPGSIGDLAVICDNAVFDITLDTTHDFDSRKGYKNIVWTKRMPFSLNLESGELIRFHTLHFQGKCKSKIYQYTTFSVTNHLFSLYLRAAFYFRKLAKKIL